MYDADQEPHTDTRVCSKDSGVIEMDAAFKKTLEIYHRIQLQQDLLTTLQQQQQREPVMDMLEWFEQNYQEKLQQREAIPETTRYTSNEKYDAFRQAVWDVRNPNVPFGQAVNSEDDVVMTTQTVSYKCPITLRIMTNPVTSRVCKHSFSDAIFQTFTNGSPDIECPIPGCDKRIRAADLKPDAALKRKVVAWLRAKRHEASEEDDCDQIAV
ncbi:hypothetical protein BDEG_21173 [Batrachochytrium dendrobatidis JEL423]|nr:hypothetical protein BDEG_21173 [Batrachochytrium dendrobatidis JEL423]